jgi:hypothetical protein
MIQRGATRPIVTESDSVTTLQTHVWSLRKLLLGGIFVFLG